MTGGTVESIWRYPVKSLQGEQIEHATLSGLGIDRDRRFGFRDVDSGSILSAKSAAGSDLLRWSARTEDDDVVIEIDGEVYSTSAQRDEIDRRCSALLERDVALVEAGADEETYESYWPEIEGLTLSDVTVEFPLAMSTERGTLVDLAALHIICSASLRHLQRLTPDSTIEVGRFRPSVVVDVEGGDGFIENEWQHRPAKLGGATLQLGMITPRCAMTTKAQPTLDRDLGVLESVAEHNRIDLEGLGTFACLGIYAEITTAGKIGVGDRFELI